MGKLLILNTRALSHAILAGTCPKLCDHMKSAADDQILVDKAWIPNGEIVNPLAQAVCQSVCRM